VPKQAVFKPLGPRAALAVGVAGCGLVLVAAWLTWCLMHRELDFDEADYLNIAGAISRTGLPWCTEGSDLGHRQLFVTSPPLAMLVASVTQAAWPSQAFPSRLVHALLFSIPIFLLVWHITWKEHGPLPALAALLILIASPLVLYYGACVRPDSPLVLFSLLSLWCFYRATQPESHARLWSLAAACSLAAGVWAKFQSVCVPVAILMYLGCLLVRRDRATLKRAIRPLVAMGCAGVGALAALYVYLYVFPGPVDDYSFGGIRGSYKVLTAHSETWRQALRSYGWVATLGVIHLGWPLVPATVGALLGRPPSNGQPNRDSQTSEVCQTSEVSGPSAVSPAEAASRGHSPADPGFAPLLVCFCLATVLFNLWVHTSPGAGSWYLAPMVPAIAILAGRCLAVALAETRPARAAALLVVVGAALALQWRDWPPWAVPLPGAYANPPEQIGLYVRDHSPAGSGVLADTSAIEFYAERPTARMQFLAPEVVLRYLAGTGQCVVTHVVLRRYSTEKPPPNLAGVWQECRKLLAQDFQPVRLGLDGIQVFQRKGIRESRPASDGRSETSR
jgi:4-amino-4-deoxy-L-arabinose transferase-like glycosyltransferase